MLPLPLVCHSWNLPLPTSHNTLPKPFYFAHSESFLYSWRSCKDLFPWTAGTISCSWWSRGSASLGGQWWITRCWLPQAGLYGLHKGKTFFHSPWAQNSLDWKGHTRITTSSPWLGTAPPHESKNVTERVVQTPLEGWAGNHPTPHSCGHLLAFQALLRSLPTHQGTTWGAQAVLSFQPSVRNSRGVALPSISCIFKSFLWTPMDVDLEDAGLF